MSSMAWDAWEAGITTSFGGLGKASLYTDRSFHGLKNNHQKEINKPVENEKYFSNFEEAKNYCINKGSGLITRKNEGFVWKKSNEFKK